MSHSVRKRNQVHPHDLPKVKGGALLDTEKTGGSARCKYDWQRSPHLRHTRDSKKTNLCLPLGNKSRVENWHGGGQMKKGETDDSANSSPPPRSLEA